MGTTCYAFLYVGSTSTYGGEIWYAPSCLGGTPPLPNSASGHVYLAGATSINRFASSGGGQWDCSAPALGYGPCFSWADDGQTVNIERVEPTLDLVATPASVNYGDTVTVTASISPGGPFDGRDVPWTIDSTSWAPAFGTQSSPCAWSHFVPNNVGPTRTCRKTFTRSGTLKVFATINGSPQSESVAIIVLPPTLGVSATPGTSLGPVSVTFTASITPTPAITWYPAWVWRNADGGTDGLSAICQWNNNPCTRTVSTSGWMKVSTTYDGYALVDSARVDILPCPTTDDSVLDNDGVRRQLMDQLKNGWIDSTADKRRERGGFIFRNPNGSYTVYNTTISSDGCNVSAGYPTNAPGIAVGRWHLHVTRYGEMIYDCNPEPGRGRTPRHFADDSYGEGADSATTATSAATGLRYPNYTLSVNGMIYRLDPVDADARLGARPDHIWQWDHGASSCTWRGSP